MAIGFSDKRVTLTLVLSLVSDHYRKPLYYCFIKKITLSPEATLRNHDLNTGQNVI